jgi:hypothetical protein
MLGPRSSPGEPNSPSAILRKRPPLLKTFFQAWFDPDIGRPWKKINGNDHECRQPGRIRWRRMGLADHTERPRARQELGCLRGARAVQQDTSQALALDGDMTVPAIMTG